MAGRESRLWRGKYRVYHAFHLTNRVMIILHGWIQPRGEVQGNSALTEEPVILHSVDYLGRNIG